MVDLSHAECRYDKHAMHVLQLGLVVSSHSRLVLTAWAGGSFALQHVLMITICHQSHMQSAHMQGLHSVAEAAMSAHILCSYAFSVQAAINCGCVASRYLVRYKGARDTDPLEKENAAEFWSYT